MPGKLFPFCEFNAHEERGPALAANFHGVQHIFPCAPPPFRWLQIPLFGVVTNVKGDLDETGRDLIVQRRGLSDRRVRSSGRQPTQTLIWFPK